MVSLRFALVLAWAATAILTLLATAPAPVSADIANAFNDDMFAGTLFPSESAPGGEVLTSRGLEGPVSCVTPDPSRLSFCSRHVTYPVSSTLLRELEARDTAAHQGVLSTDDRPRCKFYANARWQCRKHFPPCIQSSRRVAAAVAAAVATSSEPDAAPLPIPDIPMLKICRSVCEFAPVWQNGVCRFFSAQYFAQECANDAFYSSDPLFCEDIREPSDMPRSYAWRNYVAVVFAAFGALMALRLLWSWCRERSYRKKLAADLDRERRDFQAAGARSALALLKDSLSEREAVYFVSPNQRQLSRSTNSNSNSNSISNSNGASCNNNSTNSNNSSANKPAITRSGNSDSSAAAGDDAATLRQRNTNATATVAPAASDKSNSSRAEAKSAVTTPAKSKNSGASASASPKTATTATPAAGSARSPQKG